MYGAFGDCLVFVRVVIRCLIRVTTVCLVGLPGSQQMLARVMFLCVFISRRCRKMDSYAFKAMGLRSAARAGRAAQLCVTIMLAAVRASLGVGVSASPGGNMCTYQWSSGALLI